jgi:hypothetical protein
MQTWQGSEAKPCPLWVIIGHFASGSDVPFGVTPANRDVCFVPIADVSVHFC